jgi:hypothetical protein
MTIFKGKGKYIITKFCKTKRCKKCKKAVRNNNESGLCNICYYICFRKKLDKIKIKNRRKK